MKKQFGLIWICLLGIIGGAKAQLNNTVFYEPSIAISANEAYKLYLKLGNLNYFRNNEYFNRITDGYTLFGAQLSPSLTYFPSAHVMLEGGIFLMKDFGNPHFTSIQPIFTLKYHKNNFGFLFGTLDGSLQHGLIEPLYDFEYVIKNRIENGVQFLYQTHCWRADVWVDWQQMIYPGSALQEHIWGGLSAAVNLVAKPKFSLSIPLQLTARHQGGQLDTNPNKQPLVTIFNAAVGLDASLKTKPEAIVQNLRWQYYATGFIDHSTTKELPFEQGSGQYANFTIQTKWVDLLFSYWNGSRFYAPAGGGLYQSISRSVHENGYTETNRELLFVRLLKDIQLMPDLFVSIRAEPFYDFGNKRFEFSHGLYVNYRHKFLLTKVEKDN